MSDPRLTEETREVSTRSGPMSVFGARPAAAQPLPIVVFYPDMWGVRDEVYDQARRLAVNGFYCVVPDLFHRESGEPIRQSLDVEGRTRSASKMSEEELKPALARLFRLSDAMALEDTEDLFKALAAEEAADMRRVGVIGYCLGGRQAMEVACRWPDRVLAVASLHGSDLIGDGAESPHNRLGELRAAVYCGYADRDRHCGPEMIAAWERLMEEHGVRYQGVKHVGALHGYSMPTRDVYDRDAAERDWVHIAPLFEAELL